MRGFSYKIVLHLLWSRDSFGIINFATDAVRPPGITSRSFNTIRITFLLENTKKDETWKKVKTLFRDLKFQLK